MVTALADLLDHQREQIMERWAQRVLLEVIPGRPVAPPQLRDSLPEFLQQVALALRMQVPQLVSGIAPVTRAVARVHGGQRYRLGFDLRALVSEYAILREILLNMIEESGIVVEFRDLRLLWAAIATGVMEAVDQHTRERDLELAARAAEQQRASEFERKLIGIVSHDLRNPLSAILLSVEAAVRRGGLDPLTAKLLRRIETGARRATRLISDLLDYTHERKSGWIPIRPRPMCLRTVVSEVIDETRSIFPDRVIDSALSGPAEVRLDPDRMAQVVSNLLTNALKFSPKTTAVAVTTRADDHTVDIEIHNWGPPIPAERLRTIFDAYQRRDPDSQSPRSLGLGLHITHQIVLAHGGSISVRSSAADGTTFTCKLPREAAARSD